MFRMSIHIKSSLKTWTCIKKISAPQNVIYEKKATLQSTYGGLVQTIDQYDLLVQEFHVIISEALIHKNPLKIVFF